MHNAVFPIEYLNCLIVDFVQHTLHFLSQDLTVEVKNVIFFEKKDKRMLRKSCLYISLLLHEYKTIWEIIVFLKLVIVTSFNKLAAYSVIYVLKRPKKV